MNKTLKGIIGGTVLLAALGGAFAALKLTEPAADSSSEESTSVETPLWHARADDINRIAVEQPDGKSYSAVRRMDTVKSTDIDGN